MIIGGNKISKVVSSKKITNLNGNKYFYKYINLKQNDNLSVSGNSHYCIYNLSKKSYYLKYKNQKKKNFKSYCFSKKPKNKYYIKK